MSRFYLSAGIAFCLTGLVINDSARALTFPYTQNSVTYTVVEADPFLSGGSAGNTVNISNPGQFWAQNTGGNQNGLFNWRDFGGMWFNQPAGTAQSDRDLFEVSNQVGAPPNLRTTISVPNGSYDVFLAFMVEADRPSNPIPPATLAADLDIGQEKPTTLRGGRTQPGLILTGSLQGGGGYEIAMAPLGTVSGTSISTLVGPMWAADLNGDYKVGQDDLNLVLANYGQIVTPGDRSVGNTNDDQLINDADINNVTRYWGSKGYPAGLRGDYIGLAYTPHVGGVGLGNGVPEPTSLALLIFTAIGIAVFGRRRSRTFIAASVVILFLPAGWVPMASADISGTFTQVTTEGGDTPPAGYVSQDLTVNATTDWLASNMLVVLTSGTIYQDTGGGTPNPIYTGPDPTNFPFIPTLRWDTYVTGSGGLAEAAPKSAGGAVDLGGSALSAFSTSGINLEWYTTSNTDTGSFTLGRFTLQDTAQGTWQLRLDALGQTAPVTLGGNVQNGLLIASMPGDYNANGKVDGADYVLWRKNPAGFGGNPTGYTTWRANFGLPPGSGTGALSAGGAVPEPSGSLLLVSIALAAMTQSRRAVRRRCKQ